MTTDHEVVGVVTRPDRPRGRSNRLVPSAVRALVLQKWPTLPLFTPEKASTPEFMEAASQLGADLSVVVAYGEILRTNLLLLPPKGSINIHPSLLPKYRGAAPIQRSILQGESETGVTIMEMVLKMDAGPILDVEKVTIPHTMTGGELEQVLCHAAKSALLRTLTKIERNGIEKKMQEESQVTFAEKITQEDRIIHWTNSAETIHNQVRALAPSPGAFCLVNLKGETKRLIVQKALDLPDVAGESGHTLLYELDRWVVGCGQGALCLLDVQLEGKNRMSVAQFVRGMPSPPQFF